jgi:hypothetical protein
MAAGLGLVELADISRYAGCLNLVVLKYYTRVRDQGRDRRTGADGIPSFKCH